MSIITIKKKNKEMAEMVYSAEIVYSDILEKSDFSPKSEKEASMLKGIILNFFVNFNNQPNHISNTYIRKSLRDAEHKIQRIVHFSDSYSQMYLPFHNEIDKWIDSEKSPMSRAV